MGESDACQLSEPSNCYIKAFKLLFYLSNGIWFFYSSEILSFKYKTRQKNHQFWLIFIIYDEVDEQREANASK